MSCRPSPAARATTPRAYAKSRRSRNRGGSMWRIIFTERSRNKIKCAAGSEHHRPRKCPADDEGRAAVLKFLLPRNIAGSEEP